MYVTKIPIANEEAILTSLPRVDYADGYSGSFSSPKQITIEDVAYSFFDSAPTWVSQLLSLRNQLVKALGLKTFSAAERASMRKSFLIEEGVALGMFTVLRKKQDEIWVGDDDKHLNYRVALQLKQPTNHSYEVVFITVVMLNNWLGKVYFAPVKYFHRLVVKAMLRNTIRTLQKSKVA